MALGHTSVANVAGMTVSTEGGVARRLLSNTSWELQAAAAAVLLLHCGRETDTC